MATIQTTGIIIVNGYDLSCYLKSFETTADVDMHDSTTFCVTDGARTMQPGLAERGVSAEGFFAYNAVTDASSIDKILNDSLSSTANQIITVSMDGTFIIGNSALMLNTKSAAYNVQQTVGDLIMTTFEAKATKTSTENSYAMGVLLMSETLTAPEDGGSYDDGAGATTGYFAHAHNTDSDGTATVKIQHSTDNSVWVDLVDFGAVASKGAEQAYNTATSVNRYLRAIVTALGGTTSKVTVAIKTGYTG